MTIAFSLPCGNTKPNPADLGFSTVIWEKSEDSAGNDNCGEFGAIGDLVAMRDSKRPSQTPLVFTRDEIATMISGAKKGNFDHLA
ncbi:DUF397 domain-containing protein [Streptomyces uncialis]|uniref:DUF397 domain-containing protein n=1 Tax=Streptomyces uncialis TaxID=1048205 RepID=UPI00224E0D3C|nr:DUF397 domain-containing protein [Streptomyces uncialis]MCX4659116.1 DUF397 domain-containing protein [Streptomyces uncialis]